MNAFNAITDPWSIYQPRILMSICDKPYEPVPEDKNKLYDEFEALDMWLNPIEDEAKKVASLNRSFERMGSALDRHIFFLEKAFYVYFDYIKKVAGGYKRDPDTVKQQVQDIVDIYQKVRGFMEKTRNGKYPKLVEFVKRHFQHLSFRCYDAIPHCYAIIKLQDAYGSILPYRLFMEVGKGKCYSENDLMEFYTRALNKKIPSRVCHEGLLGFFSLTIRPKHIKLEDKGATPFVGRLEAELEKYYDAYYKNVTRGRGLLTEVDEKQVKWRSKLTEGSVLHSFWLRVETELCKKHHLFTLGAPDTTNPDEDLITFPITKYETWDGFMTDESERFKYLKIVRGMEWSREEGMNIPPETRQVQPHDQLQITIGKSLAAPYMNSMHPGRCWDLPIPPVEYTDPKGRFVVQRRMTPVIPLEVFEGREAPSEKPLEGVLKFLGHLVTSSETPIPLSPKYLVLSQENVLHYSQYVRKGRFDLIAIEKFLLEASAGQHDLYKAYGEQSKLFGHPYYQMAHRSIFEFIKDKTDQVDTIRKYGVINNIKDNKFGEAILALMMGIEKFLFSCSREIEAELHIGSMVPSERAKVRDIVAEKWTQFKTATFIWPTLQKEVVQEYLKTRKNSPVSK